MSFEAAKCPNCGGQLMLDDSMESGYCNHCGSKIVVQDAIQKMKIEVSGKINVTGLSLAENDIKRGRQCLEAKEWEKAQKFFLAAIDKQADSYDAWMGSLTAVTEDFTKINFKEIKWEGSTGFESTVKNCLQYANEDQKKDTVGKIKLFPGMLLKMSEEATKSSRMEVGTSRFSIGITLMFFTIIIGLVMALSHEGLKYIFIPILFLFLSLFIILKPVKPEKYVDKKYTEYTERIQMILNQYQ